MHGVVAATVNEVGEVFEFTDPMPTRNQAIAILKRHRTWLSSGVQFIRTVTYRGAPRHLYGFINGAFKS